MSPTSARAIEGVPAGSARLLYDLGSHAVEDLTHYFQLTHGHDVGVERAEFDDAMASLGAAGYRLCAPDVAWVSFHELRARYAGPLNALASNWATPPALWIGDRSQLHDNEHRD